LREALYGMLLKIFPQVITSPGLGQYTEEWYAGVEAVAKKTPLMSSMGADTFLQHDLQYNSALKLEGIAQEGEFRITISEYLQAPTLNAIIFR
jgi:hypothetical protein